MNKGRIRDAGSAKHHANLACCNGDDEGENDRSIMASDT